MSKKPTRRPPSVGKEFDDASAPEREFDPHEGPEHDAADWVELDDDHDLSTWALTPGGSIEQEVHRTVSNLKRDEYSRETEAMNTRLPDERELDFDEAFDTAARDERTPVRQGPANDRGDTRSQERDDPRRVMQEWRDAIEHGLERDFCPARDTGIDRDFCPAPDDGIDR